jgi:hypothetical protein
MNATAQCANVTLESHSFSADIAVRLRQFWCGLTGHDAIMTFEDSRMALQCVSCGHETPGIVIDAPRRRTNAPRRPR